MAMLVITRGIFFEKINQSIDPLGINRHPKLKEVEIIHVAWVEHKNITSAWEVVYVIFVKNGH